MGIAPVVVYKLRFTRRGRGKISCFPLWHWEQPGHAGVAKQAEAGDEYGGPQMKYSGPEAPLDHSGLVLRFRLGGNQPIKLIAMGSEKICNRDEAKFLGLDKRPKIAVSHTFSENSAKACIKRFFIFPGTKRKWVPGGFSILAGGGGCRVDPLSRSTQQSRVRIDPCFKILRKSKKQPKWKADH